MRKKQGVSRVILLSVVLGILIAFQVFAVTLPSSKAAYYGIEFGTEAEVGTDDVNDIWQLDTQKYNYIANGQTKTEIDLLGLNITRNVNETAWYKESNNGTVDSQIMKIDYNYSFIFNIPLADLINVSYTLLTNQTYVNSSIEFYNWTDSEFYNLTQVTNHSLAPMDLEFYNKSTTELEILIHFNITNTVDFTFWYNITFECWYSVDQIITVHYASLDTGDATLEGNVMTWIFIDNDSDDIVDYVIKWIYGGKAVLYEIMPNAISEGWWTGSLEKYWTGINWTEHAGLEKDIGNFTTNMLNVTFPSFVLNLTSSVKYSVWALLKEVQYHWWDALPNDPEWQLSTAIPGFQFIFIGLGLFLVGLVFTIKMKKFHISNKMV